MEVPTKWSRASVISFIKGLGKRVRGVCSCARMFVSARVSCKQVAAYEAWGALSCPGISIYVTPLVKEPGSGHMVMKGHQFIRPDRVVNSHISHFWEVNDCFGSPCGKSCMCHAERTLPVVAVGLENALCFTHLLCSQDVQGIKQANVLQSHKPSLLAAIAGIAKSVCVGVCLGFSVNCIG